MSVQLWMHKNEEGQRSQEMSQPLVNKKSNEEEKRKGEGAVRREARSLWSEMLPNVICKVLNNAVIVINLWWSRQEAKMLVGMGVGTIFSFVFGYLVIMSLNVGLTFEISRNVGEPQLVGVYYQRALLINFLCSALLITPMLYLSKRIFVSLTSTDFLYIGEYLYQLVPSVYAFAFYDTTQCYLHAQGHKLAPLTIQVVCVFLHLLFISSLGPAWSKNVVDVFAALAIYVYIASHPPKSWVEWTMRCFRGWTTHMRHLNLIALSTYSEALRLFFFTFLAAQLPPAQLTCHICFLNLYQLLFVVFLGIKEVVLSRIARTRLLKEEGVRAVKHCLLVSVIVVVVLMLYRTELVDFFMLSPDTQLVYYDALSVFMGAVLLDGLYNGVSIFAKAVIGRHLLVKLTVAVDYLTLVVAYYACYHYGYGFKGLWWAWLGGLTLCSCIIIIVLKMETR